MKQKIGKAALVDAVVIASLVTLFSCTENYGATAPQVPYDTAIVRKTIGGDVFLDTGGRKAPDVYIYNNSPHPPVVAKKGDTLIYRVDSLSRVTVDTLLEKKK